MWHCCNLASKESGLESASVNNDNCTVLVSGGGRTPWVSMCTVWPSHSKWLSKCRNESASNFVLSSNIPLQKLFGWFRRTQLWATGDWQLPHDNTSAHTSNLVQFLVKHQITQVTQPHYNPDLTPCNFWLFPKLKSPLKGKRFQTIDEIHKNTMGQLMVTGRTVWGPKVPTLKGTEASLFYVQCFLCLVFSSINVSIFHITWLDTFGQTSCINNIVIKFK